MFFFLSSLPQIRFEFQKFQRGTWQPTVFTVIRKDFCSVIFTETEVWYDAITSKVVPEDRHCINEKGVIKRNICPL